MEFKYSLQWLSSLFISLSSDRVRIGFNPTSYTASEDSGSVTLTITKQGNNPRDVTVFFSTQDPLDDVTAGKYSAV